jgi:hypothetical protein
MRQLGDRKPEQGGSQGAQEQSSEPPGQRTLRGQAGRKQKPGPQQPDKASEHPADRRMTQDSTSDPDGQRNQNREQQKPDDPTGRPRERSK